MGSSTHALVLLFSLLFIVRHELICGSYTDSNISCIESEREALIKLREGLKDGANRLSSWFGKDCCTWKGVGCSRKTGHVVELDLRNPIALDRDRLSHDDNYAAIFRSQSLGEGPIPDSLARLSSLIVLNLSRNSFGTSMPQFLLNMSNLASMDLSYNIFNGSIPRWLGDQVSLSVLKLTSNDFQGPIPRELCNLTQLTELDLSYNRLEGELPNSMKNLCNLRFKGVKSCMESVH
ncbi:hypothetical protein Acr_00g0069130 [Actinidia rufa]|uniref:Leucine-rich repeat-containing N-terminal plant-type domain-containing protein n=1 Tax=Actinidia rufa TaxID=165716 RepID=A0A7J0DT06_9ERIC|nr:hypothetical protein Acr_00g0069130 [Actinidia rufa]